MKRGLKHYLVLGLTALALYALYVLIVLIWQQPVPLLLLAYAVIVVVFCFINRTSIRAVRGNYAYVTGNYERARRLLKRVTAAGTKSPTAYIYYSLLLLREDKNYTEALMWLEKAGPHCNNALYERNMLTAMASCHWLGGNHAAAIKILEDMRAQHEYTNAAALTTLGYMYLSTGSFDKAEEATQLAIKDNEAYGAAWDNLGQISYIKGDMEAAKEYFKAALSKTENLADANYHLGLIHEAEGDKDAAKDYFRRAAACTIGLFNTVTEEQAQAKYNEYY